MSSTSINAIPCKLCGEGGHRASRCMELVVQPVGFWKGHRMPDEEGEEGEGDTIVSIRCLFTSKVHISRQVVVKYYAKSTNKKHYRCVFNNGLRMGMKKRVAHRR